MPPLQSGRYLIINVQFHNLAVFPDDNDYTEFVADAEDDDPAKVCGQLH